MITQLYTLMINQNILGENGIYINQISQVLKKLVEIFQETKMIVQVVVEMYHYVEGIIVMVKVLTHSKNIIIFHNIRSLNLYIQYTQSILGMLKVFLYIKIMLKWILNNFNMVRVLLVMNIVVEIQLIKKQFPQDRSHSIMIVVQLR